MSAITVDTPPTLSAGELVAFYVASAAIVIGQILEWDTSGTYVVKPHAVAASKKIAGIALTACASGEVCKVARQCEIDVVLAYDIAATDVGATLYASTNNPADLNATSSGQTAVGKITEVIDPVTNRAKIFVQAAGLQSV